MIGLIKYQQLFWPTFLDVRQDWNSWHNDANNEIEADEKFRNM